MADLDEPFRIESSDYEIERYAERAPPPRDRAAGRRVEVVTITWPLLDGLAAEHEQVAALLDVALGPTDGP